MTTPAEKQLTPLQTKAKTINDFLKSKQGAFADLLPKHLTPERMVRGVLAAATRSPKLLECTPESILTAVLVASQLGLEVGRPRGGAYLVPFRNKGRYEAVLIPDYRGLMDLAYRSGAVLSIEARVVYERDEFEMAYGTDSKLSHVPVLKDRGNMICVYSVAHVRDARPVFVVLSKEEIDKTMARSQARSDGPWITDYEAMAMKTAVKRITNWLPQASEQLRTAVEYDSRAEAGESVSDLFDFEIAGESVPDEPTRTDKMKEKMGAGAPAGESTPPAETEKKRRGRPPKNPPEEPQVPAEGVKTAAQVHEHTGQPETPESPERPVDQNPTPETPHGTETKAPRPPEIPGDVQALIDANEHPIKHAYDKLCEALAEIPMNQNSVIEVIEKHSLEWGNSCSNDAALQALGFLTREFRDAALPF